MKYHSFVVWISMVCVFLILDFVWIGVVAQSFYQSQLSFILADDIRWIPAIVFYVLYMFGLLYFVVRPNRSDLRQTLRAGALFGLIAYATYDLTNFATIAAWPLAVVLVDMVWGAIISSAVSATGHFMQKRELYDSGSIHTSI